MDLELDYIDGLYTSIAAVSALCIALIAKIKSIQKNNEHVALENRKLIADNALLEAEHLKFQLQPHTLNNILSNLKSFSDKLNRGMDALSKTLDYILYKGNTHLVTVEEEIGFIKKYLALNDLFITEIDSIKFNTDKLNEKSINFKRECVPHMITVYFIENAFKHGDVDHSEFLKINVKLTNDVFEMTVINKIKKKTISKHHGIGLSNMKKRLELLHSGRYELRNSCNEEEYYSTLIINF